MANIFPANTFLKWACAIKIHGEFLDEKSKIAIKTRILTIAKFEKKPIIQDKGIKNNNETLGKREIQFLKNE